MTALLPGFEYQRVEVEGVTLNCATAGSGPPVLMLHGYPQNHLMWRDVAASLAEDHTVVLADLRLAPPPPPLARAWRPTRSQRCARPSGPPGTASAEAPGELVGALAQHLTGQLLHAPVVVLHLAV